MPPTEVQAKPARGDIDDADLAAAAVRAGIDVLLTERAPAERDAFWHAVALLYARGSKPVGQPGRDMSDPAPVRCNLEPSHAILETAR